MEVYVLYTVSNDEDYDTEIKGVVTELKEATKWKEKSNREESYYFQKFMLNKVDETKM